MSKRLMKRVAAVCAVVLVGASTASAIPASSNVSINLSGGTEAGRAGSLGANAYQVIGAFQLSLIYQDGTTPAQVDHFNTTPGVPNFPDFENYVLTINPNGSVPIYNDGPLDLGPSNSTVQWTLDYRFRHADPNLPLDPNPYAHTILLGTIEGSGADAFLRVNSGYRSFVNDPIANTQEVFGGRILLTDLVGYEVDLSGPTPGGTLVAVVPEPAGLALLAAGAGGLLVRRRRGRID